MVTFNASFLIQILLIPNFNPIRFELTSSAICVHNMHKTVSEQYVGVMSVAETTGLSLFKRTESIILPQRFLCNWIDVNDCIKQPYCEITE